MSLFKSGSKLLAARSAGTVLSLLGLVIFSRSLGPELLGVFFLYQSMLSLLSIPADWGFAGALEKRLSEPKSNPSLFSTALTVKIIFLLIAVIFILAFRDIINQFLGQRLALFVAVGIIIQELARTAERTLRGEKRVGETAILVLSRKLIWVVGGVVLIELGFESLSLVVSYIGGSFLVLLFGFGRVHTELARPTKDSFYSLLNYGKYNFMSSVGGVVYNWMDVAMIGFLLTSSAVGRYEISWRITTITLLLTRTVGTVIFPDVSSLYSQKKFQTIGNLLSRAAGLSLLVVVPSFFGSVVLGDKVLSEIFGPEYAVAYLPLVILMSGKMSDALQSVYGRSLKAIGRPDLGVKATSLSIGINVFLNLTLIPIFGIVGAAIATTTSFIVNTALHVYYLDNFIDVKMPVSRISIFVTASTVMAVVIYAVRQIVYIDGMFTIIGIVLLGALIYFSLLLLSPSIRDDVHKITFYITKR